MFSYQEARGSVEVAFTDRFGGVGRSGELDLAEPSDERADEADLAALEENLDLVGYALARGAATSGDNPFALPNGVRPPVMVRVRQVHATGVHTVDRAWLEERSTSLPEVDALVTDLPGVALLVRAADCVPVLLADVDRAVVGAAHAGRLGLAAGIVPATLSRMRRLGARRVVAWVGPHVCGRCYEVPAAMRDEVAAAVPESFAQTSWGTPALDLGAGIRAQLDAEGVEAVAVSRCTVEDEDLFSYRREGVRAGRLGGLVWVRR